MNIFLAVIMLIHKIQINILQQTKYFLNNPRKNNLKKFSFHFLKEKKIICTLNSSNSNVKVKNITNFVSLKKI